MNYEDFNDFDNDYNNMFDMSLKEEDENFFIKENKNFSAIKEIPEEENKMDVEESHKKKNNNNNNNKNNNNNNNNNNNYEELNYDLLKNKKKYKKNSFDFSEENSQNSNSEIKNEKKIKNKKNKKKEKNPENNEFNFEFPDIDKLDELSLKEECRKYGIKNNNIKNMKKSLEEIYNFLKNKILPQNLQNDLDNFLNDENNQNPNQNNLKNDKNCLSEEKKNQIVNIIKNNKEIWGKMLLFQSLDLKDVKKVLNENKITISNIQLKELLNNLGVVLNGGWKK